MFPGCPKLSSKWTLLNLGEDARTIRYRHALAWEPLDPDLIMETAIYKRMGDIGYMHAIITVRYDTFKRYFDSKRRKFKANQI